MLVRRLNGDGIRVFSGFLDAVSENPYDPPEVPEELLQSPEYSNAFEVECDVQADYFESRFDMAEYLFTRLQDGIGPAGEGDIGLWTWLSLFYWDTLIKRDKKGGLVPGERARWIPDSGNFRKYYRHLVAGPVRIFCAHRDNPMRAFAVLANHPSEPGDIAEQLASRQEIITNRGIMEVATMLYTDAATRETKKGARGNKGGSARRLPDVIQQFDLTFDLYSMTGDEILGILPREFDRFRTK